MHSKLREYFDQAKQKGYTILECSPSKKHLKVSLRCPSGLILNTTLPCSPSDVRGVKNWFRDLRRLETVARERTMISIRKTKAHVMSEADIVHAKDVLKQMVENTNLLITAYRSTNGTGYHWFLNETRATNAKTQLPSKIPLWLLDQKLIQSADSITTADSTKEIFTVSHEGFTKIGKFLKQEAVEPLPDVATIREIVTAAEIVPVNHTTKTDAILEILKGLPEELIQQILYYGINMVKDDIEQELKKKTATLDALEEKLLLL